jgi:hypothetical protein
MNKNNENENDFEKDKEINEALKKKKLGKFYTENYNYIFQDFILPDYSSTSFIEPFVGKGHLLQFLKNYYHIDLSSLNIQFYDLEDHLPNTIVQDTLSKPPEYKDKYVVTNPPFLARNKSDKKEIYDMYGNDDLYKCFIKTIIHGDVLGGCLIVPINFLSSIRKNDIDLRQMFFMKYKIIRLNLFEEKVFEDTDYNVIAFQFERRKENDLNFHLPIFIYPDNIYKEFEISEKTHWMIGGELYHLDSNEQYEIKRVFEKEGKAEDEEIITQPNNRIFLYALDDGVKNRIRLEYFPDEKPLFVGKESDRSFASFHILPMLTEEKQRKLIERFNSFLEENRTKYHSLFLTNYRESKFTARKRISFQLVYTILKHLLSKPDL